MTICIAANSMSAFTLPCPECFHASLCFRVVHPSVSQISWKPWGNFLNCSTNFHLDGLIRFCWSKVKVTVTSLLPHIRPTLMNAISQKWLEGISLHLVSLTVTSWYSATTLFWPLFTPCSNSGTEGEKFDHISNLVGYHLETGVFYRLSVLPAWRCVFRVDII